MGNNWNLGSKPVVLFKPGEYEIIQKEVSLTGLKETWATGTVLKNNASGKFSVHILLRESRLMDSDACIKLKV